MFPAEQMLNSTEMNGWGLSRSTDERGISKKVAEKRETRVPQPAQWPRFMRHRCGPGRKVLRQEPSVLQQALDGNSRRLTGELAVSCAM